MYLDIFFEVLHIFLDICTYWQLEIGMYGIYIWKFMKMSTLILQYLIYEQILSF
jgi:hypothetical protein